MFINLKDGKIKISKSRLVDAEVTTMEDLMYRFEKGSKEILSAILDKEEFIFAYIIEKTYIREYGSSKFFIVEGWNDIEYFNKKCEEYGLEDDDGELLNWDRYAEELDYEWGFSDEYTECSYCGKVVKTSPDHYGWKPGYIILNECEIMCSDCLLEDTGYQISYISEMLHNNNHCHQPEAVKVLRQQELNNHGFYLYQDGLQNGWFEGMKDEPIDWIKKLEDRYWILFTYMPSQFYTDFQVWVKDKEMAIDYVIDGEEETWIGTVSAAEQVEYDIDIAGKVLRKRILDWNEEEW